MSISALSSASVASQLVKLASGEYTAASVAADQKDALKLSLVKLKDGNYGAAPVASEDAGSQSSSRVLSSLTTLSLGGA